MLGFLRKKQLKRLSPSKAIDQVIDVSLTPLLKSEGFKKIGRTWRKEFDDYSFIVNVQGDKWNALEAGARFVVNYGVYIPSIYEPLFDMQKPKSPKVYDCIWQWRVENSIGNELWWTVYDDTDPQVIRKEIEARVSKQCLGKFNEINSLADAGRILPRGWFGKASWGVLVNALLYAELGNLKEAKVFFLSAYKGSHDNKAFQLRVKSAAEKYGINL